MLALDLPLNNFLPKAIIPNKHFKCCQSSAVLAFSKPFQVYYIFPLCPKDAKNTSLLFFFTLRPTGTFLY